MSFWGRVWRTNIVPGNTMAGCYNVTSADQVVSNTILTDTPIGASTVQEAMGYWLDCLRRRIAANVTATNQSEVVLNIAIQRGTRTDTMFWQLTNRSGKYPLYVTINTAVDTHVATFWDMGQALDWIVLKLA